MVEQDNVQVKMNRDADISTLEIEIEILLRSQRAPDT